MQRLHLSQIGKSFSSKSILVFAIDFHQCISSVSRRLRPDFPGFLSSTLLASYRELRWFITKCLGWDEKGTSKARLVFLLRVGQAWLRASSSNSSHLLFFAEVSSCRQRLGLTPDLHFDTSSRSSAKLCRTREWADWARPIQSLLCLSSNLWHFPAGLPCFLLSPPHQQQCPEEFWPDSCCLGGIAVTLYSVHLVYLQHFSSFLTPRCHSLHLYPRVRAASRYQIVHRLGLAILQRRLHLPIPVHLGLDWEQWCLEIVFSFLRTNWVECLFHYQRLKQR